MSRPIRNSSQTIHAKKIPLEQYGRYQLVTEIASGGMATVYLCKLAGEGGFQRLYALKLMHPHLADQHEFVNMLMDEARIASRIHHPNVVGTLDVGRSGSSYYLVLEYVDGFSFGDLLRRHPDTRPPELIVPIVIDALRGLHVVHTLKDDDGHHMGLVHRDVSPANILVGSEGIARITDFGIAKARDNITHTTPGLLKGKAGYMAPEQTLGRDLDCRADVFSAGVVLWNSLTGAKLFGHGASVGAMIHSLMNETIERPSRVGLQPPAIFDEVIMKALERDPEKRYQNAEEMAQALSLALSKHTRTTSMTVADWMQETFGKELAERRKVVRESSVNERSAAIPVGRTLSGVRALDLEERDRTSRRPSLPIEVEYERGLESVGALELKRKKMWPRSMRTKAAIALIAIGVAAGGLAAQLTSSNNDSSAQHQVQPNTALGTHAHGAAAEQQAIQAPAQRPGTTPSATAPTVASPDIEQVPSAATNSTDLQAAIDDREHRESAAARRRARQPSPRVERPVSAVEPARVVAPASPAPAAAAPAENEARRSSPSVHSDPWQSMDSNPYYRGQ